MSSFYGRANTFESQYVYYKRLLTDGIHPLMARNVASTGSRMIRQTTKASQNNKAVATMATAELAKEQKLLNQIFGVNFNFSDYGEGLDSYHQIKQLIDATNTALNFADVYERNLKLTLQSQGQKGVFSWFPSYFMKAFKNQLDQILNRSVAIFKQGGITIGESLSQVLDEELTKVIEIALTDMFKHADTESGIKTDRERLKNAYALLAEHTGNLSNPNSLVSQFYDIYHISQLKQSIEKELSTFNNRSKDILYDNADKAVYGATRKEIHSRGGYSLEAIETAILDIVVKSLPANWSTNAAVYHTGQANAKADNVLTFNIDTRLIEDAYEQMAGNRGSKEARIKNVQIASRLGDQLKNIKDSFVVYFSDKNYTLNGNFKGFDVGGLGNNANAFIKSVYEGNRSMQTIMGLVNQLGEGALLSDEKELFETQFAQDLAYMLFDDFSTIGDTGNSGNAIHIMNLNGIMVPLSVFLHLLADAIEDLDDGSNAAAVRKLVTVSIEAPPILFPTQESQVAWQYTNLTKNAWLYQRKNTIANTKIQARFARNFKNLLEMIMSV